MNISHKLITLGLVFGLIGSTSAFARPTPHFENGSLSQKDGPASCSDGKNIRRDRLCGSFVD